MKIMAIIFLSAIEKRTAVAISDNTCPADRLARKRKPKLKDLNPIEINSKQIPKTSKMFKLDGILNSEIERKEQREYLETSTMRFKKIELEIMATMLVQNSASEVDRLRIPANRPQGSMWEYA